MSVHPVLHTRRLTLRPVTAEDASILLAFFRLPGVRRWLLDDVLVERAWVEREIHDARVRFEQHGAGLWAVEEPSGELVGCAGFRAFHEPPEMELLFAIRDDRCGLGYATEVGTALVQHAFAILGWEAVTASHDAEHAASGRVLAKLGFVQVGRGIRSGLDTVTWRRESTGVGPRPD
ncbi:MAG: GNAT family N-acetyltransferase [Gemmatimonadota bacterium]